MKTRLFLMCGCPGSGKSTFAKQHIDNESTLYISRDEIRFSIISEDEEYFSKEKEVFNEFVRQITEGLNQGYNVVADATHLNERSRSKILSKLYPALTNTRVVAIFMRTPLNVCVERNLTRQGTRAYVPYKDLCRMSRAAKEPTYIECNGMIDLIYTVDTNGTVTLIEKGE